MSVIDQLASSIGRSDDGPNQELARRLAESEDRTGIAEIATNLGCEEKDIQAVNTRMTSCRSSKSG